MLGARIIGNKSRDEAEKPFWISYADLMTALMMLFMVIMVVSLLSMISAQEGADKRREDAIKQVMTNIKERTKDKNIQIDFNQRVISFNEKANFANNRADVNDHTGEMLRSLAPILLEELQRDNVQEWFKRVSIEGYTSQTGDYFNNLRLSLRRAHNVLCAFLSPSNDEEDSLTPEQQKAIRRMFMVGGFSANSTTGDENKDRRVELRLEFWTPDEKLERAKYGHASDNIDQFDKMPVGECSNTSL